MAHGKCSINIWRTKISAWDSESKWPPRRPFGFLGREENFCEAQNILTPYQIQLRGEWCDRFYCLWVLFHLNKLAWAWLWVPCLFVPSHFSLVPHTVPMEHISRPKLCCRKVVAKAIGLSVHLDNFSMCKWQPELRKTMLFSYSLFFPPQLLTFNK